MRGLKDKLLNTFGYGKDVASYADAWIESFVSAAGENILIVASYADAWIESPFSFQFDGFIRVASYADAWIESLLILITLLIKFGRILRGCVD